MACKTRNQASSLITLIKNPSRFNFFQAVRLINCYLDNQGKIGHVSLKNIPRLEFPTGDIKRITFAHSDTDEVNFELHTTILGLLGQSGALPLHYTEVTLEHIAIKNHAINDFISLFNEKLLQLLYKAWERSRFYIAFENHQANKSPIINFLASLINKTADQLDIDQFIFHSGLSSKNNIAKEELEQIINGYFNLPAKIFNHLGRWITLSETEQTKIASKPNKENHNQLGRGATIGKSFWCSPNQFIVVIGPLNYQKYMQLFPKEPLYNALKNLIQHYVGIEFSFKIRTEIDPKEIPQYPLNSNKKIQLGRNSWCTTNRIAH